LCFGDAGANVGAGPAMGDDFREPGYMILIRKAFDGYHIISG
jgi:hypothetical protein